MKPITFVIKYGTMDHDKLEHSGQRQAFSKGHHVDDAPNNISYVITGCQQGKS